MPSSFLENVFETLGGFFNYIPKLINDSWKPTEKQL